MKIAVTAASGQLGAAAIRALVERVGVENVVGLARKPEKAANLGVEIRPGSYDDRPSLERALVGVDAVLLISGMDAPDKRIQQHRNVIGAAVQSGVKKIVYTSIQGPEEGSPFSPIVVSNRQTEKDVRESGLVWASAAIASTLSRTSSTSPGTKPLARSSIVQVAAYVATRPDLNSASPMHDYLPNLNSMDESINCTARKLTIHH